MNPRAKRALFAVCAYWWLSALLYRLLYQCGWNPGPFEEIGFEIACWVFANVVTIITWRIEK